MGKLLKDFDDFWNKGGQYSSEDNIYGFTIVNIKVPTKYLGK